MTHPKTLFISLILLILLWPAAAQAQAPTEVKVIYPAVEEGEDSLDLSVYFTITDGDNRPLPQANPESPAAIQLLDSGEQISVEVVKPDSPFYIVLLLDASGSMANVMPQVREAAKEAIQSIPPAAQMTVIQFSDKPTRILPNFTNDQNRIKEAIDRVQAVPNGNTCLYDSLYSTMELLGQQVKQPQERRAIIVFTDGKDEKRDTNGPCSVYAYDDVKNRAKQAPNTPIHTIGLCDSPQCGNINKAELQTMALDTFAFSLTGSQADLGDLFREIMTGLSTQWVARTTNVCVPKGEIQAVLRVTLPGQNSPLNDDFSFFSTWQCKRPVGPVGILFNGPTYDPDQDIYRLGLSLTGYETIGKVYVEVWDKEYGIQIPPPQVFENPGEIIPEFVRETQDFQPGREYSFRIKAEDKNGELIKNDKNETTLAENDFKYPLRPDADKFVVESVKTNYDTGQMTIDLNIPDEGRVEQYEGLIVDSAGQEVERFGPEVYLGKHLEINLPTTIRQAASPQEYKLTIYLTTQEGQRLSAEYPFKATPPLPPGLLERIFGVILHPAVWVSALIIFSSVAGIFYFKTRPRSEAIPAPFRPVPVSPPPPVAGVTVDVPRLRLEVLQTPGAAQKIDRVITEFPCLLGRTEGTFKFPGDETVSRRHAEILLKGHEFFLRDLGSTYGTFIDNKKLEPHHPTPLHHSTIIKLGRRTHIKLVEP